jgi:Electron transfer DM13
VDVKGDTDAAAPYAAPPEVPTRRGVLRRRWPWIAAGAAVAVALAVFVLVWFQPQKLFIDDRVDQAVPTARTPATTSEPGQAGDGPTDASTGPSVTTSTAPPGPVDLASGGFVSLDHSTGGTARVIELADGRRFVRLEGFETENGPDLYVYLSTNPAGGDEAAFDDDIANLGRLQGNIGDQNYEIPAGVDPGAYSSVVIWCDRFNSAFGAADLAAPTPPG